MRYDWCGLIVVLALVPTPAVRRKQSPLKPQKRLTAPVAAPGDARKLFESGLTAFENEHNQSALDKWRRSAVKDPRSALVHLFISLATPDPREQEYERRRAQALGARAAKRDRLLLKWLSGCGRGTIRSGHCRHE